MDWKKIGHNLLYPHIAIIICLLPISVAFLVFALVYLNPESVLAIISYLLAFYVLMVICFRVPRMVDFFKRVKRENVYISKWFSDVHLRVNVSLYASLIVNVAFGIFQLGLGFYHGSFWYYSMFAYYVCLAIMRFFLLKHTRAYHPNEEGEMEIKRYLLCGWVLLIMNLALAVIIFFMVYWNRTFVHHMITTIALAAYTFYSLTFAIINIIKFKKFNSPVYSAAKNISLISACVSMLTLETTMLTTFGGDEMYLFRTIIISVTGAVVVGLAIVVAINMIKGGTNKLKRLKTVGENTENE